VLGQPVQFRIFTVTRVYLRIARRQYTPLLPEQRTGYDLARLRAAPDCTC